MRLDGLYFLLAIVLALAYLIARPHLATVWYVNAAVAQPAPDYTLNPNDPFAPHTPSPADARRTVASVPSSRNRSLTRQIAGVFRVPQGSPDLLRLDGPKRGERRYVV
jgi:hypothetical protein